MGLFNKLFASSTESKDNEQLPWIQLNTIEELNTIKAKSATKPQIIFKHSTRCGISNMVLNQFTSKYDLETNQADLYFLDLLKYRNVSNEIAIQFNIDHQSPQLLIIKNGIVVKHGSHSAINELQL